MRTSGMSIERFKKYISYFWRW